jgi:hypothetical protein
VPIDIGVANLGFYYIASRLENGQWDGYITRRIRQVRV